MMTFRSPAGILGLVEPAAILLAPPARAARSLAARTARSGAVRAWPLRRRSPAPLPFLYGVHPEGRMAPAFELGLMEVPVDEIRGTAVGGEVQRGSDFRPLPERRTANWQSRWARIVRATSRLEFLPPVDLIATADGYWVLDGHNRVAAALDVGQIVIDANVSYLRLPGTPRAPRGALLGPMLLSRRAEQRDIWSERLAGPGAGIAAACS